MKTWNVMDSDGLVLADIRELLFIVANALAGDEHVGGATARFERFVQERMVSEEGAG